MKVQFLNPTITNKDIKEVADVLRSGWLVLGKKARDFEENFSKYLGVRETVLTNSCTTSLHISLLLAGIGPEDEVITTPLSYVSTSNAIVYCGAKPVFVDVEPETGLIDASKIEKAITKKTKAILPVHLYGQMADMKAINSIAKRHKLKVIEDGAHAIEAERNGIRPGQTSFAACFSFHVAKNITAGEGGAIALNNTKTASMARLLRRDGVENVGPKRVMKVLGYKYLTTDFQAALLDSQLKRITKQWAQRKAVYKNYVFGLRDVKGINFPETVSDSRHAYHMFVVWVNPKKRDIIRKKLGGLGIQTSIHYEPIHLEPYYKKTFGYKKGDFPVAEKLGYSTITLPLYPLLSKEAQKYVVKNVKELTR